VAQRLEGAQAKQEFERMFGGRSFAARSNNASAFFFAWRTVISEQTPQLAEGTTSLDVLAPGGDDWI
jgi:hypothetical protein